MPNALPYVGLASGAAATVLGTSQLSALWSGSANISKEERAKVGAVGFGLILIGVTLSSLSAYEIGETREEEKTLDTGEDLDED